jgi:hypothetical protein
MTLHLVSRDHNTIPVNALGLFGDVRLFNPKPGVRFKRREKSFLARNIDLEFDDFARQAILDLAPSAVIAVFAWCGGSLAGVPDGILKMIDTIDVQHLRKAEAEQNGVTDFDRCTPKSEELRMLGNADVLIAIQQEEAHVLKAVMPSKTTVCAGHSMELKQMGSPSDSISVFFAGSNYAPNSMGIGKFIESVWPAVVRIHPNATLDICGSVCAGLARFSGVRGVRLHGLVEDLTAYYAKAAVVVSVALFGTGLPIKTAEAISYGKCLVCSPPNARGFKRSDFPGTICEFDTMAARINVLLDSVDDRRRMESTIVAFAEREMKPEMVYGELTETIREYTGRNKRSQISKPLSGGFWFHIIHYPLHSVIQSHLGRVLSRVLFTVLPSPTPASAHADILRAYLRLRWRQLSVEEDIRRAAIFGAGQHTAWLESVIGNTTGPEIVAVVDDNPDSKKSFFGQLPADAKTFDPATVDAIVLSSDCFQVQMRRRCCDIYGDKAKLVDLYEDLPPGPYQK